MIPLMTHYAKKPKTWMIAIIMIFYLASATAQSEQEVRAQYGSILTSMNQNDWKAMEEKCSHLIKHIKSDDYDYLKSVVSYIHIYTLSAMVNENLIDRKKALKKAEVYKGKVLVMPGHPIGQKCFDCFWPDIEKPNELFVTVANHDKTQIYSFEYYHLDQPWSIEFSNSNMGKILKIQARLKEITMEGNSLPRFNMQFDQVEYEILNDESMVQEPLSSPFTDSLNTDFKYDININTLGSQLQKVSEFQDDEGDIVKAIIHGKYSSIKRTYVFEVLDYDEEADLMGITADIDSKLSSLNNDGGNDMVTIIRPARKIEWQNFRGFDMGLMEKSGISNNYTANGMWVYQGRVCNINYFVTDTAGHEIYYDQEQKNLKLFLDKIKISETPVVVNSISQDHGTLLRKMSIGLDTTKCSESENDKNCLQIFAENTGNFTFSNVTSEAFENITAHPDKGFIIPYIPGTLIKMIFTNDKETVKHPFKIPELPK